MERLVEASDTDWTVVRPPRLVDGAQRDYRIKVGALPDGAWSMSCADLAAFLLDEAERRGHVKGVVGLGSAKSGMVGEAGIEPATSSL